jgi:formyltetrahydrofolate deformylase
VHAVTGLLAEHGCNIVDSSQFGAADTGLFFMRVHVQATDDIDVAGLRAAFAPVGDAYGMDWQLHDRAARERVVVLVSKLGHCLNDLLYRHSTGALRADLVAVVSNHPDFRGLVEAHGVPFHHVPVPPGGKAEAEARLLEIVAAERAELVVLARYMQVLSDDLCARLPDTINIHHSFLPSFKGARPYHQAYERGVKLIGATAHYVTAELDEGPIIEQEVARVDHAATPERLVEVGRDLECIALARAVAWHLDHRVLRNGARTVVFP